MNVSSLEHSVIDVDSFDWRNVCPICGLNNLAIPYRFEEFDVVKCTDCESSWRSNMYNKEKMAEIYCDSDYETNPYFDRDESEEQSLGQDRYRDYANGLSRLGELTQGRLLDVGAGSGTFLRMAEKAGWQVEGVEMSPRLAEYASDGGRIPMHTSAFEELDIPANHLDAISFWDVIEHVSDPRTVIQKTFELLKPGGAVLFCTPDEDSLLPRVGQLMYHLGVRYPALALHPTNHTYFFSRSSFTALLEEIGFNVQHAYSQAAFFEHSEMASAAQKAGIRAIESVASLFDRRYEMVLVATKPAG